MTWVAFPPSTIPIPVDRGGFRPEPNAIPVQFAPAWNNAALKEIADALNNIADAIRATATGGRDLAR